MDWEMLVHKGGIHRGTKPWSHKSTYRSSEFSQLKNQTVKILLLSWLGKWFSFPRKHKLLLPRWQQRELLSKEHEELSGMLSTVLMCSNNGHWESVALNRTAPPRAGSPGEGGSQNRANSASVEDKEATDLIVIYCLLSISLMAAVAGLWQRFIV